MHSPVCVCLFVVCLQDACDKQVPVQMFYFVLRLMISPVGEQMSASAPMSELPGEHCGRLMFIRWTPLFG